MKFLFIIDKIQSKANAVYFIAMHVARQMQIQGHSVVITGERDSDDTAVETMPAGIRLKLFCDSTNASKHRIVREYHQGKKNRFATIRRLMSPKVARSTVQRLILGYNPVAKRYCKEIESIIAKEQIDAAVAFTAPYYTAIALAHSRIGTVQKMLFMMDPYSTHYQMGGWRTAQIESRTLSRLDHAFVTHDIYEQYAGGKMAKYFKKMTAVEFPSLVERETVEPSFHFSGNGIQCLYAGNFYKDIRTPNALVRLLPLCDDEIHVTLMGELPDSAADECRAQMDRLACANRLTLCGYQPSAIALRAMESADILLNIGNACGNMFPSKLLDYVSTGLPIINLCREDDLRSQEFLDRYPLGINIIAGADAQTNAERFVSFCKRNAGKRVPFAEVEALYAEFTPRYAVDKIVNACTSDNDGVHERIIKRKGDNDAERL